MIELMVVLLIMAILLAIAIPTFLSVTNGAKRTALQSDLTNAEESAQAQYTNTGGKWPAVEATFVTNMQKTQTTITFVTQLTELVAGKNVLAAFTTPTTLHATTSQLTWFVGLDGNDWCWIAVINYARTLTATTGPPKGDSYGAIKWTETNHQCGTLANPGTGTVTWKKNIRTVKGT